MTKAAKKPSSKNLKRYSFSKYQLLIFILIFAAVGGYAIYKSFAASSTNVYITQNALGANNGADCADAHAASFFNSSANWGTNTGQIGPGTTVHLCGTITTALGIQGSGTSANPITILFETNAKISMPVCDYNNGCLASFNDNYITIDGGTNGIIEATGNGGGRANQLASNGLFLTGCNNCEVKNLTIQNIYVHNGMNDESSSVSNGDNAVQIYDGNNFTFDHNTVHDADYAVYFRYDVSGQGQNVNVHDNNTYNVSHNYALTFNYAGGNTGPYMFHNNHMHDWDSWDTVDDAYHHSGLHCFTSETNGAAAHINGLYWYNNLSDGAIGGSNTTSGVFTEGGGGGGSGTPCADSTSDLYFFNNVVISDGPINNGLMCLCSVSRNHMFNNTMISSTTSDGVGTSFDGTPGTDDFKNNLVSTANQLMVVDSGIFASGSPDYNVYANGGGNAYHCNNNFLDFSQFASWQSCIGGAGDAHSKSVANAMVNANGSPQAGSPVIGAGTNLTSLCTGMLLPLCSDYNGNARPATGAWDAGAFQFSSGGGGGGGGDTTAPAVSLTAPTSGATVSGSSVSVSANASDNVGVASVQFKLDGTNLGSADTTSPYTVTWNSTTASNGSHVLTAVATDTSGNSTTSLAITVTTSNVVSNCSQSSTSWQNTGLASQSSNFSLDFDTTPGSNNMDGVTGVSNGAATDYSSLAAIVRFNTSGFIDAINGSAYASDMSVPYSGGSTYHIKLAINVAAKTYSIFVTPAGGSQVTLGTNYAFRTEQSGVSSLNNWAILAETGNHSVCSVTVTTSSIIGDLNNDSHVSLPDLTILLANWHTTNAVADINSSGQVDTADLSILLSHYGT